MNERLKKMWLFTASLLIAGMLGVAVHQQTILARTSNPAQNISTSDAASNRVLQWVYNGDNVAHEDGDVLVWSDGTYDGLEVTTTTSASDRLVAGVAYGTIGATSWGWLQVSGYHAAIQMAEDNAAGDALVTTTTGEEAGVANSGNDGVVFAIALDAQTSSTTVKGFIIR